MNEDFQKIKDAIDGANEVSVFCHTNPDGDAIGSLLAIFTALKRLGKNVRAICDTPLADRFDCFFNHECVELPTKCASDLAIAVDCAAIDRLGLASKCYLSAKYRVAIDHHESFVPFGQINVLDAHSASCSEIVFKLLKYMDCVDKDVAKLLFSGLVTDSGCFQFSNTTKLTHMTACELMDFGFDAADTIFNVFRATEMNRFHLKVRALNKAKFCFEEQIGLIVFERGDFEATNTTPNDTEGIINELIDINSVKVAIAIAEVKEHSFKVSIRTKDPVNARAIAGAFGGGGHFNAAGCRVSGFLQDVVDKLLREAELTIEESKR